MPKHKYTILRTDKELGIAIETDEPLPHIAIGNRLIVENAQLAQDGGTFLKIRDIEMTLQVYQPPEAQVTHIVLYVEAVPSL